jgi:HPt (histidine-containing phosphotransfer) domain-containing protein
MCVTLSENWKKLMETAEQYPEVFDASLALSSVGGDHEFLTELVGLAQAAWPTLLTDIRSGMAQGDLPAVQRAARLAKAAAHNVSAKRAYESALQLEAATSMGDLQAAQRASVDLEREVELLRVFLSVLGNDECSP